MSRETLPLSKWFELFRPKPQMLHNQSLWHQPRGVMAPASCRSSHGAARAQEPGSERTIQWEIAANKQSQWIICWIQAEWLCAGRIGITNILCCWCQHVHSLSHNWEGGKKTCNTGQSPLWHHKWPLLQMSLLTHTVTRNLTKTLFLGFFFGIVIFGVSSPNCLDLKFFRFSWRTHQNRLLFWQWFCDLSFPVTAATELRPRFLPLSAIC